MVLNASRKALSGLLDTKARSVVLKSLGLTILLFFGVWFGVERLMSAYVVPMIEGWTWLVTALVWTLSAGFLVAGGFFLAPVTALFAGLFLDEIAEQVERDIYPEDPSGSAMPAGQSVLMAIKFGILVLFANLIALVLVWFAGFGVIIFFLLNGFLIGREYFQFAAMRHHEEASAREITGKFSLEIFVAGLVIAAFMSIPILNFLTPVFAAKQMVHLHKEVTRQS